MAEYWQEVVCTVAVTVNALMKAFGGSAPFFQFVEEKCDIPVPQTGDDTSA